jgi:hypothetical protein
MHSFAKKPNSPQQAMSAKSTAPRRAHSGQSREVTLSRHPQRTLGDQKMPQSLQVNAEGLGTKSSTAATARFTHDFSLMPVLSSTRSRIQAKRQPIFLHANNVSAIESTLAKKGISYAAQHQASDSAIGPGLGSLIDRSRPNRRLPADVLPALNGIPGQTLEKIQIHDDSAAHEAAQRLEAHAFTIGSSIYFASGAYQPTTKTGLRILAHEAAHAHQQINASLPPTDRLVVSPPSSQEEIEAGRFADTLNGETSAATPVQLQTGNVARLMRVTFETTHTDPVPFNIADRVYPNPVAGQFSFGLGGGPEMELQGVTYPAEPFLFSWEKEVKIHGTPDEKFSDWEVGMLQTMRDYRFDVWWGEGPNAKRCSLALSNLHDGLDLAIPWFDQKTTQGPFQSEGESLRTEIHDSPGAQVPYQNLTAEPSESFGKFDYHASFVAYVSAHDRNAGDSLDAFRQLESVRWEVNLKGDFDGRQSPPQIHATGETKVENVIVVPGEKPPVIGGPLAFDELRKIFDCWTPKSGK